MADPVADATPAPAPSPAVDITPLTQALEKMAGGQTALAAKIDELEERSRQQIVIPSHPADEPKVTRGQWMEVVIKMLSGERVPEMQLRALDDIITTDNVGVVPDAVYANALEREPPPFYFLPLQQNYESGMTMLVRTAGDPMSMLPAVRQAVREVDRKLVVAQPRTLDDEFSRSVGSQALMATLVTLFGALALLLAAIGLYGVMAHAAGQRRTEIGIRLALGATPSEILRLIVGDGLRLVTIGAALGLAAALVASRAIENQLFGVKAVDPLTYGAVAAVLAAVALTACLIPARRAMRLDPVVALRKT